MAAVATNDTPDDVLNEIVQAVSQVPHLSTRTMMVRVDHVQAQFDKLSTKAGWREISTDVAGVAGTAITNTRSFVVTYALGSVRLGMKASEALILGELPIGDVPLSVNNLYAVHEFAMGSKERLFVSEPITIRPVAGADATEPYHMSTLHIFVAAHSMPRYSALYVAVVGDRVWTGIRSRCKLDVLAEDLVHTLCESAWMST
jgi:hypothetical protein